MENISNHTDLTVFTSLLLLLFFLRRNKFLIYFGIQCCQITISNTLEASSSFLKSKNKCQLKGQNHLKFEGESKLEPRQ